MHFSKNIQIKNRDKFKNIEHCFHVTIFEFSYTGGFISRGFRLFCQYKCHALKLASTFQELDIYI